jgi:formate dehydrogenase subunit gamma
MTPVYKPWDEARGAEIITGHDELEGASLVILHALQAAFGYVPEPAIPMIASLLPRALRHRAIGDARWPPRRPAG